MLTRLQFFDKKSLNSFVILKKTKVHRQLNRIIGRKKILVYHELTEYFEKFKRRN